MKRSKSSTGRGKSGKFSKPRSFSKGTGAKSSRGGGKPIRAGGGSNRFKKEDPKPEGGYVKRSSESFKARKPFISGDGPRPERFKRDGDKPERREFKSRSGPARKSSSFSSRGGDRPDRFKRDGDKPERKNFNKPFDKPSRGTGNYLRRKEDRPDFKRGEEGDSDKRNSFKPRGEDSAPAFREVRKPFREKRAMEGTGGFDERKKRKRIGDSDKPFEKRENKSTERSFRLTRSAPGDNSPKSFGEKRYEKRPPKERKMGSFERRPPADHGDKPWNRKEKHEFYGERKKKAPEFLKASEDGSIRLNKYIANAGICSRREADELIEAGVISVNGEVITEMGYKVMPGDNVKYNNELLRSERLVYILLNKPKDFITTTDDPEDRKTVMNLIAKACKERVYPVGRLDRNTTGVLLFTNDGDLAKKLTHPSFQVHKIYQAELDRALKTTDMDAISAGVTLDDGFIKPDEIVYAGKEKNVVGMELHSGKNRIVRRIFEHLGYEVKKLDRVVFAGLTKKDLPRGRWRFLTEMEVANLKMITGKKSVKV